MEEDKYIKVPTTNNRLLRTHAVPLVGGADRGEGELAKPLDFDNYEDYLYDWRQRSFTYGQTPLNRDKWKELKAAQNKKKMLEEHKDAKLRKDMGLPPKRKKDTQEDTPVVAVPDFVEPDVEELEDEQPKPVFRGTKKQYERREKAKKG